MMTVRIWKRQTVKQLPEMTKRERHKKNTTKGSDRTDKKRVTMPSGTPEPSHTTTPTPTPTPSGIEKKEKSGHMITCTSPVNVRDAASSQSRVIGELAKGDQVEKTCVRTAAG